MGAFPVRAAEAAGPLSALPLDCLAELMSYLTEWKSLFAFAKTCRRATRALGIRPLRGLPVMFVSRVILCEGVYYVEYRGCPEIDVLPANRAAVPQDARRPRAHPAGALYRDVASLAQRRRAHFVVVYTYDHHFLVAWCDVPRWA